MQFEMCGFGFAPLNHAKPEHIFTITGQSTKPYPGKYKKMLKVWGICRLNVWKAEEIWTISVARSLMFWQVCSRSRGLDVRGMQEDEEALVPEAIGPI